MAAAACRAGQVPFLPGLDPIPPDSAPDGETGIARHAGGGAHPVLHSGLVGAASQHHGLDAVAAAAADEGAIRGRSPRRCRCPRSSRRRARPRLPGSRRWPPASDRAAGGRRRRQALPADQGQSGGGWPGRAVRRGTCGPAPAASRPAGAAARPGARLTSGSSAGFQRTRALAKSGSKSSRWAPNSSPYSKSKTSCPDFSTGTTSRTPGFLAARATAAPVSSSTRIPAAAAGAPPGERHPEALPDQALGVLAAAAARRAWPPGR